MSLYTIADLHLSLGGDKPMDIFSGWDNYLEKLTFNWNYMVKEEDTVVIIGDISWAMSLQGAYLDFKYINDTLNGKKIIVRGNHDYWFSTKAACDKFLDQNGFDKIKILFNNSYEYDDVVICGSRGWVNENGEQATAKILAREAGRLKLSLDHGLRTGKKPIVFLHYPPIYSSNECIEILDVLLQYKITECYYGHIHGRGANYAINGVRDGIQYSLVSCDFTQFNPVKIR